MTPLLSMVRAAIAAFAAGGIAGYVLYRVGAPVLWAVVIALPIAALTMLVGRLPRATDVVWQPLPSHYSSASSVQASTLAGRLAEAAADQDRFATRVQPRLRRLALARLRQTHGIADLEEARELLGPDVHRLLTDPKAPLTDLDELLEKLEDL
jgi:hypothetical protein